MQDLFSVNIEDGIRCFSGILNGDHLQPVTKKKLVSGEHFVILIKDTRKLILSVRGFPLFENIKKRGNLDQMKKTKALKWHHTTLNL